MFDDFTMIIHELPPRDTIIIPIGDVHLGAREHMTREWEAFCKGILERENAYLFIGGDMFNNGVKTSVSNVYEEVMRPREAKREMVRMLTPLRDRILAGVGGNHERRNKDVDNDPLYDVFCKLDIEERYRSNLAFVKVRLSDGNRNTPGDNRPCYTFVLAHGAGSSIYTTSAAARPERFGMAIDGMDCQITFHTHKPLNAPVGKIKIDQQNNKVSVVPWRLVVGSSWLNYAGYAGQKLLTPTVHCKQEILLSGRGKELKVIQ